MLHKFFDNQFEVGFPGFRGFPDDFSQGVLVTLPETNSSHLQGGLPKRKFILQPQFFKCELLVPRRVHPFGFSPKMSLHHQLSIWKNFHCFPMVGMVINLIVGVDIPI